MVCSLIGNWYGIFIQIVLAVVAFLTLLIKKKCEKNPRSWGVWLRDVSKQGFGMLVAHGWNIAYANIAVKVITDANKDVCAWYFVNYLLDTSIGTIINYAFFSIVEFYAKKRNLHNLESGNYDPELPTFTTEDASNGKITKCLHTPNEKWILQLLVWCLVVSISKCVIFFCIVSPFQNPLDDFTKYITKRFEHHDRIELLMVMVVAPFILNIFQLWIQDIFLKRRTIRGNYDTYLLQFTDNYASL
jgi:hypothetical protein